MSAYRVVWVGDRGSDIEFCKRRGGFGLSYYCRHGEVLKRGGCRGISAREIDGQVCGCGWSWRCAGLGLESKDVKESTGIWVWVTPVIVSTSNGKMTLREWCREH